MNRLEYVNAFLLYLTMEGHGWVTPPESILEMVILGPLPKAG